MSLAFRAVVIRQECSQDVSEVRRLNLLAFPHAAEANLVDALRANGKASLAPVAVKNNQIVGHILFSPVTLESKNHKRPVWGLAPMAVLPELQGQGVGSLLVKAGILHCKQAGVDAIVVLGHDHYYPRFGFKKASQFGVRCEYDVPEDVFLLLELAEGAGERISGLAKYQPEFASV